MATTTSTNADVKTALNQAKHKFSINKLNEEISAGANLISSSIADTLIDEISENYRDVILYNTYVLKDAQYRGDTAIFKEKYGRGYRVGVSGSQVIYDEFGTGTQGENFSHPDKNKYNLDDYNSGAFIRTNKEGIKYWTYFSPVTNKRVSSKGVPAGMFMYNSFNNVANNIEKNIDLEPIMKQIKNNIAKGK